MDVFSTPPYAFMGWCLVDDKGQLYIALFIIDYVFRGASVLSKVRDGAV